jgi:hypothetical protein
VIGVSRRWLLVVLIGLLLAGCVEVSVESDEPPAAGPTTYDEAFAQAQQDLREDDAYAADACIFPKGTRITDDDREGLVVIFEENEGVDREVAEGLADGTIAFCEYEVADIPPVPGDADTAGWLALVGGVWADASAEMQQEACADFNADPDSVENLLLDMPPAVATSGQRKAWADAWLTTLENECD